MADRRLDVTIMGERLTLVTRPGLFSPEHVDRGTLAMLSVAGFAPGLQVMDLGCATAWSGSLRRKSAALKTW